jgi:hypothetical protein
MPSAPTFAPLKARTVFFLVCLTLLGLGACSSTPPYKYRYIPGRTATESGGYAVAPPSAPSRVNQAIQAGNQIVGAPYRMGGGHGAYMDGTFDCSGATSYVLRAAGLTKGSMPSASFRRYGRPGPGRWISVYARQGHVFLVVAGLRFDTGWHGAAEGPRWTTQGRPARGYVIRHPAGY